MIRITASLLALISLAACATNQPVEQPAYLGLGMAVDAGPKGQFLFSLGLPDPLDGDRVRLHRHRMDPRTCVWRTADPLILKAADVGIVTFSDGGIIMGPARRSREMAATFERLVAARGLRPTVEERACAQRLIEQVAYNEDEN